MTPRPIDVDLGVCRAQVFDRGAERWVIVLPGANYSPDAPLLWFAREAALAAGCNALTVWDTYDRDAVPLAWVEERTKAALRQVGAGSRPLLVAKSLTSLAAPLAARLGLPAVWLTPLINAAGTSVAQSVVDGLTATSAPCLLVGGTADPSWDPELARSVPGARVLEIADADHALQIAGDVLRSLDALRTVVEAMRDLMSDGSAPAREGRGAIDSTR